MAWFHSCLPPPLELCCEGISELDVRWWTPVLGHCPHDGISARSSTQGPRADAKSNAIAKIAGQLPQSQVFSPLLTGEGCRTRLPTRAGVGGVAPKGLTR